MDMIWVWVADMTTENTLKSTTHDVVLTSKQVTYLTELYLIIRNAGIMDDELVATSLLSDALYDTRSNTSRMIERLQKRGMLHHVPYQGIRLTEEGEKHALIRLRKRRIINTFLVTVMGFDWHEIYDETRRIESSTDDTVLQRMFVLAGQPTHDPFGEHIPEEGEIPQDDDTLLTNAPVKATYRLSRVTIRTTDRLQYLDALGIRPETEFELLSRAPFDGPLQIKIGREYRILGHNLATVIWVSAITPTDN
ncbi:MAG: metal-dependent transcriptional regulator [Chloroflexota bacterium]